MSGSFEFLHCPAWGQGLLQFLVLLCVGDDQGIKVSAALDLTFHIVLLFLSFFEKDFIYLFLEREREREGKKHRCAKETSIGCLLHTPNLGPSLLPKN